ncbi:alpha/beta fold hydrolase [Actinacidiphila rubida]|uniref:Pimeloyl-ACP methyl ester carboxylesterase n=1 Tax=Actinacidiphila rubida TaxID=310780 RepID=A0A1H8UP14_9ACTN|nr:alpha/beta hydrolase [Actinacidiphila rubida]SEP04713.1 Pimeloyl-ACP methyl ester carboxylesterase [Actinacidiphila rubida]
MEEIQEVRHQIETPHGYIVARDYPGQGTPFVFLHGFPDDSAVYEKLIREVQPRRSVSFDFPGYGLSERTGETSVADGQRLAETEAVIDGLGLEKIVLVGHDAGGPVAIQYALAHPDRVERLVLLNCYFGESPTLKFPEMIRLLGDPNLAPLADALISDPGQRQWLLEFTATKFGYPATEDLREQIIIPVFYGGAGKPDALAAVRGWTARLLRDVATTSELVASGKTQDLHVPVDVIFGKQDPYLNTGVAEHLASIFPNSRLRLVEARHWLQWDAPGPVAQMLLDTE